MQQLELEDLKMGLLGPLLSRLVQIQQYLFFFLQGCNLYCQNELTRSSSLTGKGVGDNFPFFLLSKKISPSYCSTASQLLLLQMPQLSSACFPSLITGYVMQVEQIGMQQGQSRIDVQSLTFNLVFVQPDKSKYSAISIQ